MRVVVVLSLIMVVTALVLLAYALGLRHGAQQAQAEADATEATGAHEQPAPTTSPEPTEPPEDRAPEDGASPERDSQFDPPAGGEGQHEAETGSALYAVADLEVGASDPRDGYERRDFGWRTFDHDGNGCDIRNDVLRRDLIDVETRAGTHGCVVETGTLDDPYTATQIDFVRGGGHASDGGVQIDHVVSLFNSWISGAQEWDEETMVIFANDPLNLLAVDGPANQAKGASDAANWLPTNSDYHCPYVARQVAVKLEYELTATAAEVSAMSEVLTDCPEEPLPTEAEAATP